MYKPVIGLEVHVELNTKSKMFCACSADYFGKAPNTHTCPVCLGLPGALPHANAEALKKCIQIGLALNCSITEDSLFERKNYFYPDLAKGFQISQLRWPLCTGGWIEVESETGEKSKIRINRVHQEEDTGKLTHSGSETLIDFNRSGVPLVEIVTEPDFTDSSQIRDYAKKLQQIFRYLGVSNADMEKGDMRLEANISVRPEGQTELPPYRVELKNINSFRFMVAAVEYEIKRQIEAIQNGEKLHQETRGWDEDRKQTVLQRSKEEANDYRYFPEPDLPKIKVNVGKLVVEEIRATIPELPVARAQRYISDYGLSGKVAETLVLDLSLAEVKDVANYIANFKLDPAKISPDEIIQAVKEKKSGKIEDESELTKIAEDVIKENEVSVAAFKGGKENALQALIGGMMRKTQGKADAGKSREVLIKLLKTNE
jgi:aspartyl-tRNA(Asn)/glutamyl-tRNA(Gln) amidotransferase subunit B